MTVYNLNRGIGFASSGVEYAQIYRAKIFRQIGVPAKFIFTDLFRMENIEHMTKNIGFEDSEIIWLYQFYTDFKIAPGSFTYAQLEATFPKEPDRKKDFEKEGAVRYYFEEDGMYVTAYSARGDRDCVQRAEYVSGGRLIRRDVYSYAKIFSEFFVPREGKAVSVMRRFYNTDGSEAYTEIVNEKNSMFRFPDRIIDSKEKLIADLISRLGLTREDVVIVDRAAEIGRGALQNHGEARIGSVVHAEHYNEGATTDKNILWNNHYDYEFTNADKIDFFITATDTQHQILEKQFMDYIKARPKVATIPVGSLERLRKPSGERKKHALITASRLATEKHIDWVIRAVVAAREKVPDISLDIYGKGGEESTLQDLIESSGAEDYIHLMGHKDLADIYQQYEAYVSGSTSEGFGLTLMEAVGSGLPMIGFDVHYGNKTFIEEGKNGFLVPYTMDKTMKDHVAGLSDALIRLFTREDLTAFSEHSYKIAEGFLTKKVEEAWKELLWKN